MVSPADDDAQSTERRGDLLFAGGALIAVGLLLFVAKDLSSVTGILRPQLTAAIAIAMIILGAFAVVLELSHVLELSAKSRRRTREEKRAAAVPVEAAVAAAEPEPEREPEPAPDAMSTPPVPFGIHAVGYVALSVSNRDRSLAWYRDVLGFEEGFRQDGGNRRVSVMRFGPGGYSIGLVERVATVDLPFDPARQGLDHLAFAVRSRAELVEWAERLTTAGVPHSAVVDIAPGAILNLVDPDGIGLALFWDSTAPAPG